MAKDAVKDQLEDAYKKRSSKYTLESIGREFTIHKWTLRKGFKYSNKCLDILKSIGGNIGGDWMKKDLTEVLSKFEDEVIEILKGTLEKENFKDAEECAEFVEDLSLDECAAFMTVIIKQNFRPLAGRLKGIGGAVSGKEDGKDKTLESTTPANSSTETSKTGETVQAT